MRAIRTNTGREDVSLLGRLVPVDDDPAGATGTRRDEMAKPFPSTEEALGHEQNTNVWASRRDGRTFNGKFYGSLSWRQKPAINRSTKRMVFGNREVAGEWGSITKIRKSRHSLFINR